MTRKTNLLLGVVVSSVMFAACSGNANTTAETTVAKVCNPPAQLDCAGANLSGANLRGAILTLADFSEADLSGADLRGADLRGANLTDATMPDGTIHP